eukprot:334115-Chlamydomonas_euryale.AAC.7
MRFSAAMTGRPGDIWNVASIDRAMAASTGRAAVPRAASGASSARAFSCGWCRSRPLLPARHFAQHRVHELREVVVKPRGRPQHVGEALRRQARRVGRAGCRDARQQARVGVAQPAQRVRQHRQTLRGERV